MTKLLIYELLYLPLNELRVGSVYIHNTKLKTMLIMAIR